MELAKAHYTSKRTWAHLVHVTRSDGIIIDVRQNKLYMYLNLGEALVVSESSETETMQDYVDHSANPKPKQGTAHHGTQAPPGQVPETRVEMKQTIKRASSMNA